ncbi:MAG: hypothetical protein EOO38_21320 [Cytophagaceae bacterium]|nr:MAG: hypothetical protein EOO38_21320 [Cytophagaceae bacterium]
MSPTSPIYVYIAADSGGGPSYVGMASTLVDLPWIAQLGVDSLLWFAAENPELASDRAEELRTMSELDREAVFLRHNPTRSDLTPRIWASDPDD